MNKTGYIHSIDTFGSVDGPGVRFVIFMQGCMMRCRYCHNPDTWKLPEGINPPGNISNVCQSSNEFPDKDDFGANGLKNIDFKVYSPETLLRQALRYKSYWKGGGGITVSGGEPLLQADFLCELFRLAKAQNVHTTLDTAGQPFTTEGPFFSTLKTLIENTDLVILDIKCIDPERHRALTGHSNESILNFAKFLNEIHKPMWVRHVLVPGVTDDEENLRGIRKFLDTLSNVEKVEILPYHTLGIYKWENLGIPYSLSDVRLPDDNDIKRAESFLIRP